MQQKQSGTEGRNDITIEGDLNDLKPGTPVDGYEYGAEMHTDGVRLEDTSEGKTVSIRTFEFKMNPDPAVRKSFPQDKQSLFNAHAKQISAILWADGLSPLEGVPPRVIVDSKKKIYRIFVPAQANRSNIFIEKPKSLQTQLNGTPRH